jgi:adenosylhomocysteine nucleosidase
MHRMALIAAMEREIQPLTKGWNPVRRGYGGRTLQFFENNGVIAVAAGIGFEAARRASEAAVALFRVEQLVSIGFAGGLDPAWKAGRVFEPGRVVDGRDGSQYTAGSGRDVLVSFASIASVEQKRKLAAAYGAQAVDMEAAAVAKAAQVRGLGFRAVKVISDELGFELPGMERFVASDGKFSAGRFGFSLSYRPWLWPKVMTLARSSSRGAEELAKYIRAMDPIRDPRSQLNSKVGA